MKHSDLSILLKVDQVYSVHSAGVLSPLFSAWCFVWDCPALETEGEHQSLSRGMVPTICRTKRTVIWSPGQLDLAGPWCPEITHLFGSAPGDSRRTAHVQT